MNESHIRNVIEAALLAAGKPLQAAELVELFDEGARPQLQDVLAALNALMAEYSNRGIEIKETAAGFRIQVRREMANEISRLWPERPARYSRALLETLALIAYRQPITRAEIEAVRGVAVNPNILKTVIERNWVRVVGHRDVPGRPELLGTTRDFLDYFGLRSLDELPPLAELKSIGDIKLQFDLPDPGPIPLASDGSGAGGAAEGGVVAEGAVVAQGGAVAEVADGAAAAESGALAEVAAVADGGDVAHGAVGATDAASDGVSSTDGDFAIDTAADGAASDGDAQSAATTAESTAAHDISSVDDISPVGDLTLEASAGNHFAAITDADGSNTGTGDLTMDGVIASGETPEGQAVHAAIDEDGATRTGHKVAAVIAGDQATGVEESATSPADDAPNAAARVSGGRSVRKRRGKAHSSDSALHEAEEFAASVDADLAEGDDDGSDDDELSAAGPDSSELVAGPRDIDD